MIFAHWRFRQAVRCEDGWPHLLVKHGVVGAEEVEVLELKQEDEKKSLPPSDVAR